MPRGGESADLLRFGAFESFEGVWRFVGVGRGIEDDAAVLGWVPLLVLLSSAGVDDVASVLRVRKAGELTIRIKEVRGEGDARLDRYGSRTSAGRGGTCTGS